MLETLVPVDIEGLGVDRQTYALFTNERGGVLDDLIITRWAADNFFLVVNAGCKVEDIAHLRAHLQGQDLTVLEEQALLALQGPEARQVMRGLCPAAAELVFMQGCHADIDGAQVYITCSGYTGEDGFEISVPATHAVALARRLLAQAPVEAIGLGARDSLRLESGLCLYGHELTPDIDPGAGGPVVVDQQATPVRWRTRRRVPGSGGDLSAHDRRRSTAPGRPGCRGKTAGKGRHGGDGW